MEKTKDIFKNAKAGDIFLSYDGNEVIYIETRTPDWWKKDYRHVCAMYHYGGVLLFSDSGRCEPGKINNEGCSVVCRWENANISDKPYTYHPHDIVQSVCKAFHIDLREVRRRCRRREYSYPRQAIAYYLSKYTTLSPTQIGMVIDVDRAVAWYSIKAWGNRLMYPDTQEYDNRVMEYLKGL